MAELTVYTDGGSRGNPGKSAIGIVILDSSKKILMEYKEFIGLGTNNQAEYHAIIKALNLAKKFEGKTLHFFSDSELMIKQLKGEYKVRNIGLSKLYEKVKLLEKDFEKINYSNVRRTNEFIQIADSLVNNALDNN